MSELIVRAVPLGGYDGIQCGTNHNQDVLPLAIPVYLSATWSHTYDLPIPHHPHRLGHYTGGTSIFRVRAHLGLHPKPGGRLYQQPNRLVPDVHYEYRHRLHHLPSAYTGKYLAISIFCLGFFTCIISVVRLFTLHHALNTTDLT